MRDFSHTRLQTLRTERGLSRVDFADNAAISYFTVRGVELGDRRPSLRVLARMADTLGVAIDELFEPANA